MKSKEVHCIDCQRVFMRKELNRHGRCHDCAWKIMCESCAQLHNHQGPQYEKWKEAVQAAASKL